MDRKGKITKILSLLLVLGLVFIPLAVIVQANEMDPPAGGVDSQTADQDEGAGQLPEETPEAEEQQEEASPVTEDPAEDDGHDHLYTEDAQAQDEGEIELISYGLYPKSKAVSTFAIGGDGTVAKFVADNHAVMLRADGRLMVWGDNRYGQLGLGADAATTIYEPTENTFFKKMGASIVDIAVCEDATFVLLSNGELYSFGKGTNGRLGLGNSNNTNVPTLVPGSEYLRITKLHTGKEFVIAETDANTLYAWGRNNYGQLGAGNKTDRNTPTKIMDNANVSLLTVGADFVTLLKLDGSYYVWGNNDSGQYGFDTEVDPSSRSVSCSLNGVNSCPGTKISGNNFQYQSPYGTFKTFVTATSPFTINCTEKLSPYQIVKSGGGSFNTLSELQQITQSSFNGTVQSISAHTLTLTGSVTASHNTDQNNSHNSATATATWKYVLPNAFAYFDNSNIVEIQLGNNYGIANINGTYYGWGDNSMTQQGTSGNDNGYMVILTQLNEFMVNLNKSGEGFGELVVAGNTGYILTSGGDVYAWGANTNGKAGLGTALSANTPTKITNLQGKSIASIVPGRSAVFYVCHDGSVYVSGDNAYGQTGLGEGQKSNNKVTTPQKIETFKYSATALPPNAPGSLNHPEEVTAGDQIVIQWGSVSGAAGYELKRVVTYKDTGLSLMSLEAYETVSEEAEMVYTGGQTTFTDTADDSWNTITYSVQATNSIGDYSPAKSSAQINVLAKIEEDNTDPGEDDNNTGGDNNNNNSGGGISSDDLMAIIEAIKGGGISSDDLMAIIEAINSGKSSDGGISGDDLRAIIAAINSGQSDYDLTAVIKEINRGKNRSNTDYSELYTLIEQYGKNSVSANDLFAALTEKSDNSSGMNESLLKALVERGGETITIVPSGDSGGGISAVIPLESLLSAQSGQTSDLLSYALAYKILSDESANGTQLTSTWPGYYQTQASGGLTTKNLSLYLIIIMIIAVIGLVVVRVIPESCGEGEDV